MGFVFQDHIFAGTVLVRGQIQSGNYIAGVSGWALFQNGSAEVNNVTVRGDLYVLGANGAYTTITNPNNANILMGPPTMSTPGLTAIAGVILATQLNAADSFAALALLSPRPQIGASTSVVARIDLQSGNTSGSLDPIATVTADLAVTGTTLLNDDVTISTTVTNLDGQSYLKGQCGTKLVSFTINTSNSTNVTFPIPFPSGTIPVVFCNIDDASAVTLRWTSKATAVDENGFTILSANRDPTVGGSVWSSIFVQWTAITSG